MTCAFRQVARVGQVLTWVLCWGSVGVLGCLAPQTRPEGHSPIDDPDPELAPKRPEPSPEHAVNEPTVEQPIYPPSPVHSESLSSGSFVSELVVGAFMTLIMPTLL